MTQDGLASKREQLDDLEKSEREARRLGEALGRGRVNNNGPLQNPVEGETQAYDGENSAGDQTEGQDGNQAPSSTYIPPHPGPNPARRRTRPPGMGLLDAISYTLHGMMDVDPETARRNGITKTRETISQVSSSHKLLLMSIALRSTSWKMVYIWRPKILNILAPRYKQI